MSSVVKKMVNSAEELSGKLRETTGDIRELDIQGEETLKSIEATALSVIRLQQQLANRRPTKKQKTAQAALEKKFESEKEVVEQCCHEKVTKAGDMYDIVDGVFQKVDKSWKQMQTSINRERARLGLMDGESAKLLLTKTPAAIAKEVKPQIGTRTEPNRRNSKMGGRKQNQSLPGGGGGVLLTPQPNPSRENYLPSPSRTAPPYPLDFGLFDTNEPRYCLCNQVSYGEMVGCDGDDCRIEWFHFECVGLTKKPKGEWYCPQCQALKVEKNKD